MEGNSQKPLIQQKKLSEPQSANNLFNQQNPINYGNNVQNGNQNPQQYQPQQIYPQVQGYMPPNPYANNQGFAPYQPYPNQNQNFQGYVPNAGNQQYPSPPPYPHYYNPISPSITLKIPQNITPAHPSYPQILQSLQTPCPVCATKDTDFVSSSIGCTAISWSVCLFCFTGIFCFWIPLVVDDCKDVQVNCIKCGYRKCLVQKPCC